MAQIRGVLERYESSDEGTFGRLAVDIDDTRYTFFSLELPDRDNAPNVSCIPTGTYTCRWTLSARFKRYMFLIDDVPERTGIRIHSANFAGDDTKGFKKQLNGCVSIGLQLGVMDNQKAVLLSSPAIRCFETLINGQTFTLEIK